MKKISACLVVRHEEKIIKRCLDSLLGAVDEIIVVHDGECADKTLEIVSIYTDKIFIRPFSGFMEKHLVFAFNQAQGDWILRIDADEFLSPELRDNLRKLAEQEECTGYEFIWSYWDGTKRITEKWPYKRCFFRRDRLSFLGVPHFTPAVAGKVEKNDFVLEHRPFYDNFSMASFWKKWLPWAKIQAEYYGKDFSQIEKFNYHFKDWPPNIILRKRHPLLLAAPDFFIGFGRCFFSFGSENIFLLFKFSFFEALYRLTVDYYVFKLSRPKENGQLPLK
jgi:glycosyltransferase involved in cell wall biosynthesis